MGQLAQYVGTLPEVKKLGEMMEEDHRKSLNDLTKLTEKNDRYIGPVKRQHIEYI